MTSYVCLWETPSGERHWEAITKEQVNGFLEKLLNSGVRPATIMMAYGPILFHWVWPKFHKGLSDVNFHRINDEIYGTEPASESNHMPVDVPLTKEKPELKFGWLSPDGRFFGCDYGGHSSLARKIVGSIQYFSDPERYLEELGWAKVLSGSYNRTRYTVGMGADKKLTNEQIKTIHRMGLEDAHGVSSLL